MLGRGHHRDWELSLYYTLRASPLITIYFKFVSWHVDILFWTFWVDFIKEMKRLWILLIKKNMFIFMFAYIQLIKCSLNPKFWCSKLWVWVDLDISGWAITAYEWQSTPPAPLHLHTWLVVPESRLVAHVRTVAGAGTTAVWRSCESRGQVPGVVSSGYTEREMRTTRRCS